MRNRRLLWAAKRRVETMEETAPHWSRMRIRLEQPRQTRGRSASGRRSVYRDVDGSAGDQNTLAKDIHSCSPISDDWWINRREQRTTPRGRDSARRSVGLLPALVGRLSHVSANGCLS